MKRERHFSATEISEIICEVDQLELADNETAHNRIRYLSKRSFVDTSGIDRPLLQGGVQIDARGKRAYPALEVYRAAIFNDLMALAIDVRALQAVVNAASKDTPLSLIPQKDRPASTRVDGGWVSRGALKDAIRGVEQGESWVLTLEHKHGGHSRESLITARIFPVIEGQNWLEDRHETDEIYGARRTRTFVQVDLSELFGGIIEQIGAV